MKVVLAGPPQSGKSCLREGLKTSLKTKGLYPFILTACPDGEGAWFQETAGRSPALARQLKDDYKSSFTPGFVDRIAEAVRRLSMPLSLIDIGGRISPENRAICAGATHAVVLANDPARFEELTKTVSFVVQFIT